MEKLNIKIKKLNPITKLPEYKAYAEGEGGNTGADLFSIIDVVIPPMGLGLVPTGLIVEVPAGIDMQIRSKSGMALEKVFVLNSPGTIDPSYRGEVKVILLNLSDDFYEIKKGDKIAQAVFAPVMYAEFVEDKELSETKRGVNGFGGSGKK